MNIHPYYGCNPHFLTLKINSDLNRQKFSSHFFSMTGACTLDPGDGSIALDLFLGFNRIKAWWLRWMEKPHGNQPLFFRFGGVEEARSKRMVTKG